MTIGAIGLSLGWAALTAAYLIDRRRAALMTEVLARMEPLRAERDRAQAERNQLVMTLIGEQWYTKSGVLRLDMTHLTLSTDQVTSPSPKTIQ